MRTKQKILQLSKEKLGFISFAIFFNILLAGSVCGTFAWYSYATRTGFEKQYHGVTIGATGELDVGIISTIELAEYAQFELVEDKDTLADESKIIYWCDNEIKPEVLNYIIGENGSATNILRPVTTSSNETIEGNEGFHLYKSPSFLRNYGLDDSYYADSDSYIHIPFVFRYRDPDISDDYIDDEKIYFKECKSEVNDNNLHSEINKAIRVYTDSGFEKHLINPTAIDDSYDVVGGILDLNKDGFYDHFDGREFIYGETNSYSYNDNVTANDGTLPIEERNTFVSNHKAGVYAINDSTFEPKVVNYSCMRKFANKSIPVTKTEASYHHLARLDYYAFIEGWDLHVIDREIGCAFNMNVLFGISIDE